MLTWRFIAHTLSIRILPYFAYEEFLNKAYFACAAAERVALAEAGDWGVTSCKVSMGGGGLKLENLGQK